MKSVDALLLAEFIIFVSLLASAYYYAFLPSRSRYTGTNRVLWMVMLQRL